MSVAGEVFDLLLAIALPLVAWRALAARTLFQAVVLFISFGLFLSLWWARRGALDVALAEAALGAGFTGALLLDALVRLEVESTLRQRAHYLARTLRVALVLGFGVACLTAALGLLAGAQVERPLTAAVARALPATGMENPVTAVLLNFRGYDTLLEVGVVLAAVIAAWSVLPGRRLEQARLRSVGPVLPAFARILVPITVLLSGYVLLTGTTTPGGAFGASALLAGAGVVWWSAGRVLPLDRDRAPLRFGMAAGFALFLGTAVGVMAGGRNLLEYPRGWAYPLAVLVEVGSMISIALILSVLFVGERVSTGSEAKRP